MFNFLRRHRTFVLISLALIVAIVPFVGIGTTSMQASPMDVIAKINGQPVRQGEFDKMYRQLSRQSENLAPEARQKLAETAFHELVKQEVFVQEAERYGLKVTDQEVQIQLASMPAFRKDGKFDYGTYYNRVVQSFGIAPKDFEKNYRKELLARKVNALVASSVRGPASAADAKLADEQRKQEIALVMNDWYTQLNNNIRIDLTSDRFRKTLASPAQ